MKKPKQPDRWEREAMKLAGKKSGLLWQEAADLLRREHRAIVRMVRGERWCSEDSDYAKTYNQAIDNILAKLKARGQ